MRKRWIASFALSLGLLANSVQAGDDPWRMPPKPPAANVPAVTIGRPIAVDNTTPPTLPPLVDNQVRPTGFTSCARSQHSSTSPGRDAVAVW